MDEPGPDLFEAEHLRRTTEVPGATGDMLQIRTLCVLREVANPHVVQHALAERRHDETPWKSDGIARLSIFILLQLTRPSDWPLKSSVYRLVRSTDAHTGSPPLPRQQFGTRRVIPSVVLSCTDARSPMSRLISPQPGSTWRLGEVFITLSGEPYPLVVGSR